MPAAGAELLISASRRVAPAQRHSLAREFQKAPESKAQLLSPVVQIMWFPLASCVFTEDFSVFQLWVLVVRPAASQRSAGPLFEQVPVKNAS